MTPERLSIRAVDRRGWFGLTEMFGAPSVIDVALSTVWTGVLEWES